MRTFGFIFAVLAVVACGRTEPVAQEVAPIAAGETIVVAPVAAEVVSVASGLEVGLVYAGNMMGELEPCG